MRQRRLLKFPKSYSFAVSPRQTRVAAMGRNVVLADLQRRARIGSVHPLPHPSQADYSRDESRLVVRNTSGFLAVLRASDGELLTGYVGPEAGEGPGTFFSPCDRHLVEASWGGGIRVRNADTLQVEKQFAFPTDMIISVSADRERQTWLFAHSPLHHPGMKPGLPYLNLWRWPLQKPAARLPINLHHLDSAELSPCGGYVALRGSERGAGKDRKLQVMRTDGTLLHSISSPIGGTGGAVRWSPDGCLVAATVPTGYAVYEAATLTCLATFPLNFPSDLAFLDDGTVLLGSWEAGRQEPLCLDRQALIAIDASRH